MMIKNSRFTLIAENAKGSTINLTEDLDNIIAEYDGFNPPAALIVASEMSSHDGNIVKSTRLGARNVVLTISPRRDWETNREKLYKVFRTKQYIKLKLKNNLRDIFCEGYVESIEHNQFVQKPTMQVSIVCGDPYLYSVESESENSETRAAAFTFPFSIDSSGTAFGTITRVSAMTLENEGDAPIGIKCTMQATGAVTNPYFWNTSTGEQLKLTATMVDGDEIIINTNSGKKSITKNGTNILGKMTDSSKWVTLDIGTNLVGHSADSGSANLIVTYEFTEKYMAV